MTAKGLIDPYLRDVIMTPEQEQLLVQAVLRLEQKHEHFQQVISETRADMAQLTDWAETVTQVLIRLEEQKNELTAQLAQSQALSNARMDRIEASLEQATQSQALSNARMDRIEANLERLEQVFENSLGHWGDQG